MGMARCTLLLGVGPRSYLDVKTMCKQGMGAGLLSLIQWV